jgi:hypothetical protein
MPDCQIVEAILYLDRAGCAWRYLPALQVDYLPGDREPKPVWLWWSATGALPADVDRCWQAFLRRFDLEHTFRLFKQVLVDCTEDPRPGRC